MNLLRNIQIYKYKMYCHIEYIDQHENVHIYAVKKYVIFYEIVINIIK